VLHTQTNECSYFLTKHTLKVSKHDTTPKENDTKMTIINHDLLKMIHLYIPVKMLSDCKIICTQPNNIIH